MKKAIALFLVIMILAGGLLYMRRMEMKDRERMQALYATVEPLQRERETLQAQRDSLDTDYALQMRDAGTVELIFRELSAGIFTDVYPQMRDRGIVGVLGISTQQYPGFRDKLKVEQYSRLLMDGWGSCFLYEKVGDFQAWYKQMTEWLERDGLPVPTAIFFADNSYDSSLDETLAACGIRTVIVGAEDGHSNTVTPVGSGIWYTGAMPWNYTGVNGDTEQLARTDGANLAFTISFKNLWDAYEAAAFGKVLDNWVSMQVSGDPLQAASGNTAAAENELQKPMLKVLNFEQAYEAHSQAESRNAALAMELTQRKQELDSQIAALDEQIRGIYDAWGGQSNMEE